MMTPVKMRKPQQALTEAQQYEVLQGAAYGTLALGGEYPYSVPVNFAFAEGCIYFHSARVGEKIERLRRDARVSFSAVEKAEILPQRFSTAYRSVICFGTAKIVTDEETRQKGFRLLVQKYAAEYLDRLEASYQRSGRAAEIVCIRIEHMTGKYNDD